jgi:hypothetical protein
MLSLVSEYMLVASEVSPDDWQPEDAHVVTLPVSSAVSLDTEYSPPAMLAPDESLLRELHESVTRLLEVEVLLSHSEDPAGTVSRRLSNPSMTAAIQNSTPC